MNPTLTESGYKTSRASNNTLIIHDVEIFCETERGGKIFDASWLNEAFAYAMQQQQDKYLPPLHVKHHAPGNEVKAAGKFQIKELRKIPYKGQMVFALIADLHVNDDETEQALMQGKFPYRSVEITDVDKPAIDGLALLDHDAPYLELPMLMIGSPMGVSHETLFQSWRIENCRKDRSMMACFSRSTSGVRLLFDMPSNTKLPKSMQFAAKPGTLATVWDDDGYDYGSETRLDDEELKAHEEALNAAYDKAGFDKNADGEYGGDIEGAITDLENYGWTRDEILETIFDNYDDTTKKAKPDNWEPLDDATGADYLEEQNVEDDMMDESDREDEIIAAGLKEGLSDEEIVAKVREEIPNIDEHSMIEVAINEQDPSRGMTTDEHAAAQDAAEGSQPSVSLEEGIEQEEKIEAMVANLADWFGLEQDDVEELINNDALDKLSQRDIDSLIDGTPINEIEGFAELEAAMNPTEDGGMGGDAHDDDETIGEIGHRTVHGPKQRSLDAVEDILKLDDAQPEDLDAAFEILSDAGYSDANAEKIIDDMSSGAYRERKDAQVADEAPDAVDEAHAAAEAGERSPIDEEEAADEEELAREIQLSIDIGVEEGLTADEITEIISEDFGPDVAESVASDIMDATEGAGEGKMDEEMLAHEISERISDGVEAGQTEDEIVEMLDDEFGLGDGAFSEEIRADVKDELTRKSSEGETEEGGKGDKDKKDKKSGPGVRHDPGSGQFMPGNMEKNKMNLQKRKRAIKNLIARAKARKFEKDYEGEKSEKMDDDIGAASAVDASAIIAAITDGTISISDFDEIKSAMAGRETETAEPVEEILDTVATAAVPGESMSKGSYKLRFAKMQGQIERLKAENRARKESESSAKDVTEAYDRLKDRPLGSDLEERLVSFRKSHGKAAFSAYVDSLAQTVGILPGDTAAANFGAQNSEVSEVAMNYHDQGAEAVDRANSFCKQHEQLALMGSTIPLERYVELNMKRTS